ncbi:MAG: endonuclease/exonuclease/phosphatase family protein [Flavobacteriaceae bacterium]|nr:endonuclease/exonuclease/phosphatase family protein [Flavobacteriaceae bacterium]
MRKRFAFLYLPLLLYFALGSCLLAAQEKREAQLRTIAFYNVENLFDTIDQANIADDSHTPNGKYQWNKGRYYHKLHQLARVIANIGPKDNFSGPDILGLAEIENKSVLKDLSQQRLIRGQYYRFIHKDSPDARGIDVALLYKEGVFIPGTVKYYRLFLHNEDGHTKQTRLQMVVSGYMDGDPLHFIVNHWPSRRGGEALTAPHRQKAALLNMRIIDSIRRLKPDAKIIGMGDFNDNPTDKSFKKTLRTRSEIQKDSIPFLYNPMEKMYKKGIGSLAYGDQWHLFDQLYMTNTLLPYNDSGLVYYTAGVYAPDFLLTKRGRFKNYPWRSYAGGSYTGGFSDHFPVYIYLIKR